MDKNTLQRMSQEVLVIPLSEEAAEALNRFCKSQIDGITYDRLDEMVMCFITRTNDEDLKSKFEKFLEAENLSSEVPSLTLMPILEEYVVLLAIELCEDDEEKALYSLMLKNALLLAVKGNGFVARPQELVEIFECYYDFLTRNKVFDDEDENNNVIRNLLDADEESFADKLNEVENGILRAIVYDAALHRYNNFVDGLKLNADNLPLSIYILINQLIDKSTWRYIDLNVAMTLKKLLGKYQKTEITLGEMKNSLKEMISEANKEYRFTSVLLRLLAGDGVGIELSDDTIFKAEELALYLYYELLAETIARVLDETSN